MAFCSLDLSGYADRSNRELGFMVMSGKNQSDDDYLSATPIPAPGALLLGGLGSVIIGCLRRRGIFV